MATSDSREVVKAASRWNKERRFVLTGQLRDSTGQRRFHKCTEVQTNRKFLLKRVDVGGSDATNWQRDLDTWSQLRHEHILGYEDAWVRADLQFVLCEPAAVCLSVLLQDMRPHRPCHRLFPMWLFQILSAVEYMHERNNEDQPILHRNLHPDNILVTSRCDLKLCHFATSKRLEQQQGTTQTVIGQGTFQSPEIKQGRPYDKSTDIWSFGVTAVHIGDYGRAKTGKNVSFEDILAEPEGIQSMDCVWSNSYKCFNCCKQLCYTIHSLLFGICIAMEWGVEFAEIAFIHIWYVTPFFKVIEINCGCLQKVYGMCVHCCLDPCCEACGMLFQAFKK